MDMTFRQTDLWRKTDSQWKLIHQHISFPVDLETVGHGFEDVIRKTYLASIIRCVRSLVNKVAGFAPATAALLIARRVAVRVEPG